jgi:hypothetical protein
MILNKRYSKIEIIDNANINLKESSYQKGWTELYRQTIPNRGEIVSSTEYGRGVDIYFYPYGILTTPFGTLIKNKNIIIANNRMVLPGILTCRTRYTPKQHGIISSVEMEYLMVLYSNVPHIQRGDIVIIGSKQSLKINYFINQDYRRVSFIQPQAVYIVINKHSGIHAGPYYELVEDIKAESPYLMDDSDKTGIGVSANSVKFYSHSELSMRINNKPHRIIRKENFKALSPA